MREIEPTLPVFGLRTLDELLDQSLTNERIMLRLLCVFADIELLLPPSVCMACSSYIVSQRTREVGVGMALGATTVSVRLLILGQGLRLTCIGLWFPEIGNEVSGIRENRSGSG